MRCYYKLLLSLATHYDTGRNFNSLAVERVKSVYNEHTFLFIYLCGILAQFGANDQRKVQDHFLHALLKLT